VQRQRASNSFVFDFGGGTIYRMAADGTVTTLDTFANEEGSRPNGLIQASDRNFYGTTRTTVFRIAPGGGFATLTRFNSLINDDPALPIQARDGNFYGTTMFAGAGFAGRASTGQ